MNKNLKMMIFLLIVTIGPFVMWGLIHVASIHAESQHLELAPGLRGSFIRIVAAYLTGIIYIVLLVIWYFKYKNVSWGLRLLPLLPLFVFLGSRAYRDLRFESEKQSFTAETFMSEVSLDCKKDFRRELVDGQKAIDVDNYISWVCIEYFLTKQHYDIPKDKMEEILDDSLPKIMDQLQKEPLYEEHYDASTSNTSYTLVTIESWSYDPSTFKLSIKYSSKDETRIYYIDIK